MSVAAAEWPAIGTMARVVVTVPAAIEAARRIVAEELAELDVACSRFRSDSEIATVAASAGEWTTISPLLGEVLGCALDVAERTDGGVDPTMGNDLTWLGYDRDFDELSLIASSDPGTALTVGLARRRTWRDVELDRLGCRVRTPRGVVLDLGAVAKAWCADRCAERVFGATGAGVLVSLGGDIATAGNSPDGGWLVRAQDRPRDAASGPTCTVALSAGSALATSSTVGRSWMRGATLLHHILDPATRRPADPVWRTVTVAAATCVEANAASTASIVRGWQAVEWLRRNGLSARLVDGRGVVRTVGQWPAETAA
jgi:thiamine biosynthesis lipoprotein